MNTTDMPSPIAGPLIAETRAKRFLLTLLVPMYNEEDSADQFFDAPELDACGGEAEMQCIAERDLPAEIDDFCLMGGSAIRTLPARNRFMKGLFAWADFKGTTIAYDIRPWVGGTSAYGFWRLWKLTLDGITAFSTCRLRVWDASGQRALDAGPDMHADP